MRRGFTARRGITLIEMMVVMVIVTGIFTAAAVAISGITRANLKSEGLHVAGTMKFAYGRAAIGQRYHRMVFDLDTNEYWVEVAEQNEIDGPPVIPQLSTIGNPDGDGATSRPSGRRGYDADDDEGGVFGRQRPGFAAVDSLVVKRRKLDNSIEIYSVETLGSERPVTTGQASITFFPNGFVERSLVVLSNGDGGYITLETEPLTGRVHVLTGKVEADSEFFEEEEAR